MQFVEREPGIFLEKVKINDASEQKRTGRNETGDAD